MIAERKTRRRSESESNISVRCCLRVCDLLQSLRKGSTVDTFITSRDRTKSNKYEILSEYYMKYYMI